MQQGDPLGPLLFACAWQEVAKALPDDLLLNSWYLDDGLLVGKPADVAAAVSIIIAKGAEMGIALNPEKCKIWGPGQDCITDACLASFPRVPWASGAGITVLGLPVDHPDSTSYGEEVLCDILSRLRDACGLLSHLGHPHHQHLLVRYCLDACRVVHFLRGTPASPAMLQLLSQARDALMQVLRDSVGSTPLDAFAEAQACLPLRKGGCGIKDPLLVRVPARIAGILTYLHRCRSLGLLECGPHNPPLIF